MSIVVRTPTDEMPRVDMLSSGRLLDAVACGMLLVDAAGYIQSANHRAASMWGLSTTSLVGCHLETLLATANAALDLALAAHQGAEGAPPLLWSIVHTDGSERLLPVTVLADGADYVITIHSQATPSTADGRLRIVQTQLATVLAQSTDAICIKDRAGYYLHANPAFCRLTQRTTEQLIGYRDHDIFSPAYADSIIATDQEAMVSGGVVLYQRGIVVKGEKRIIQITKAPYDDGNGAAQAIIGIFHDITERQSAEAALQASEARLRLLMAQLPAMVWSVDRELHLTFLGGNALAEMPLEPAAFLGQSSRCYFAQLDPLFVDPGQEARALAGESVTFEQVMLKRTFQCQVEPLRDFAGMIIGCIGTAIDITLQAAAHAALEHLAQQRRHVLELSQAISATLSRDAVTSQILASLDEVVDYDYCMLFQLDERGHLVAIDKRVHGPHRDLVGSWTIPPGQGLLHVAIEQGRGMLCNNAQHDPRSAYPGDQRPACDHMICIPFRGALTGALGIRRAADPPFTSEEFDIVQLFVNHVSLALDNALLFEQTQASEQKYRTLFTELRDAVLVTDPNGQLLDANPAAVRLLALPERAAWPQLRPIRHQLANAAELAEHFPVWQQQGTVRDFETVLHRLDGRDLDVAGSAMIIFGRDGQPLLHVGIFRDISERKQVERDLRRAHAYQLRLSTELARSRDLLRTLFDGLHDGMLLLNRDGMVLTANQAAATLFEVPLGVVIAGVWADLCEPDHLQACGALVTATLADGIARHQRIPCHRAHGPTWLIDLQALPLLDMNGVVEQVVVHFVDVTEQVQLEALAMENERHTATGRLAATIAHELNTPLQSIKHCLYLATTARPQERATYMQLVGEEIDRISGVLRQILDLHRPQYAQLQPIDLNSLLERVVLLTGHTLSEQLITVERALGPTLPPVWGRPDQLTQVFLNLLLNAVAVMPQGGRITLATMSGVLEDQAAVRPALICRISDTGPGIPAELLARIWEPFFTTRREGTGLGLAITQKIVVMHGGSIQVDSLVGHGSTFTVFLPLNDPHPPIEE